MCMCTPKMLDGFGETMSKTKGNGVDPLDIIELYGTDAPALRHREDRHRNARCATAGVEHLPALRQRSAGEARAHVHADQETHLPGVQEGVSPRRAVADRRP